MLDCREVGRSVFGSDPAFVITEDHIENPVQTILDGPVITDDAPDLVGGESQGGEIETGFSFGFALDFTDTFDHHDAF